MVVDDLVWTNKEIVSQIRGKFQITTGESDFEIKYTACVQDHLFL